MQVLSSGQVSLPPPPNLAGEVLSIEQLSLPPPPNLAGEVVTVVTKCPAGTLAIHRPDGFAAGKKNCARQTKEYTAQTKMNSPTETWTPVAASPTPPATWWRCPGCGRPPSAPSPPRTRVRPRPCDS